MKSNFLNLLLAALLGLSGQSYAAARGQVMKGAQVVLCSGWVLTVTEEGGTSHVHLCPDMVLSLMAGQAWEPEPGLPVFFAVHRIFSPSLPVYRKLSYPILCMFPRGPPALSERSYSESSSLVLTKTT